MTNNLYQTLQNLTSMNLWLQNQLVLEASHCFFHFTTRHQGRAFLALLTILMRNSSLMTNYFVVMHQNMTPMVKAPILCSQHIWHPNPGGQLWQEDVSKVCTLLGHIAKSPHGVAGDIYQLQVLISSINQTLFKTKPW